MKKVIVLLSCCCAIFLASAAGLYLKEQELLTYISHQVFEKGKALAFTRPSREVVFESGGLTLYGSLYIPSGRGLLPDRGQSPGIVLTHGGTQQGRKLPLYQVLSHKLRQHGYVVLSFDFRGYGESEDPEISDLEQDLNFGEDVRQAVSYLMSVPQVDASQIYLAGHSFGAGVIIPAGVGDERINGIVAIAPGRRGFELFWGPEASAKHYPRGRLAEDMEIPALRRMPVDVINPILQYVTIDTILQFPEHQPLLLIDGALEDPKDLKFLRALYQQITEPKTYVTIPDAEHYFGVNRDAEQEGRYYLVTYWPHILDELVGTIDSWIRSQDVLLDRE